MFESVAEFDKDVEAVLAGLERMPVLGFRTFSGTGIIGVDRAAIGLVRYYLRVMDVPSPTSLMMGCVQRVPAGLELPKADDYRLQLEDKIHHLSVHGSVVEHIANHDIVIHWVFEASKQAGKHNVLLMRSARPSPPAPAPVMRWRQC